MTFGKDYSDYPDGVANALRRVGGIYVVSEKSGVSPQTVRKILLGQSSNSRVFREAAEKRIAKLLGIPISAFGKSDT